MKKPGIPLVVCLVLLGLAGVSLLTDWGWERYRLRNEWELLEQEPPTVEKVETILADCAWIRELSITEGELRGGKPGGATLTLRWGGDWYAPGVGMAIAWEAIWSEPPGYGADEISFTWYCINAEGKKLGIGPRGAWAAAQMDGDHYRLRDHGWMDLERWMIPHKADRSLGWIELQTGTGSMNLYTADLTMTYTAGDRSFTDRMRVEWDGLGDT